jgi:hypothetical protein
VVAIPMLMWAGVDAARGLRRSVAIVAAGTDRVAGGAR